MERYFTSESVSRGHPDKLADQISDAVLDGFLEKDPNSRVACETFITDGLVVVGGEAHSDAYVDIKSLAREVIKSAGYTSEFCFDPNNFGFINTLHEQSSDIRLGVEQENSLGAGDQGIMFGYACRETSALMPLTIEMANKTMLMYDLLRKDMGEFDCMGPDAKCQYTMLYQDGKPVSVSNIVLSMQHKMSASYEDIGRCAISLINNVINYNPEFSKYIDLASVKIDVNPSGRFVIGGPKGDTGLTGRKIVADTYGGWAPHGGGAFSGKDATKVDRSAAYMARYFAKNIVAAGACNECLIQVSYEIGKELPVSIYVKTDAGDKYDEKVFEIINKYYLDMFTPSRIMYRFSLNSPIYYPTSFFGHFGRDAISADGKMFFPWEEINKSLTAMFE